MLKSIRFSLTFTLIVLSLKTSFAQENFFLDDWEPKTISNPENYVEVQQTSSQTNVNVVINFAQIVNKVSKYNFGNNANIYSTTMWDNLQLVNDLRNLNPHVLRFPGGNLSQNFWWNRAPGDRPDDIPDDIYVDYGMDDSDDAMTVDDYYKLLDVLGCTGMITVNYGYARYGTSENPVASAAHLAAEWVRYDNGRTKFWEIGNENYGEWQAGYEIDQNINQDGQPQIIAGDLYGEHALIFADSMKAAAAEIDHDIFIGFQAWESENSYNSVQTFWNELMMPVIGETPDYYIVHNYYTPYDEDSDAATILNSYKKAEEFKVSVNNDLSDAGLNEKPITMTEYNIFAVGSQQMVSHINGLHAVLVTGNVIKEDYGLTARWNLANYWEGGNDHGMFSQSDPSVPDFTAYPDFYHMTFFQRYFGDSMVYAVSTSQDLVTYASLFSSGQAGIAIINKGEIEKTVELLIQNFDLAERYYWYELKDDRGDGSFSKNVVINGEGPSEGYYGPADYNSIIPYSAEYDGNVKIDIAPYSAVYMLLEGGSPVSTEENGESNIVSEFRLEQNYPNPFSAGGGSPFVRNPTTTIKYSLPNIDQKHSLTKSNDIMRQSSVWNYDVTLKLYDVLGREVATLVNSSQLPGNYSVRFDGNDLPSGLYFYTLTAGEYVVTKKMLLLK